MAKSILKLEARKLREQGLGIKTIANKINISSSTISLWCRDIQLSTEQVNQLQLNAHNPYYGKRKVYLDNLKLIKQKENLDLNNEAEKIIGNLNSRDLLMIGLSLYWAEGFKKDKMVGFSNTDPNMIQLVIRWLIEIFNVSQKRIKLRVVINQSHKYRINEIEKFWSKITKIPAKKFYPPTFQNIVWQKSYEHPENYYGVLRIRVLKSTKLLKLIKFIIEKVSVNLKSN